MNYEIKIGDSLEVLKSMDDESVHCCVTSPPYWALRNYDMDGQLGQEASPEEYVDKLVEIMEKCYGKKFKKKYVKKQPGDVLKTKANIDIEIKRFKFKFMYSLNTGMEKFYVWYKSYKNEIR